MMDANLQSDNLKRMFAECESILSSESKYCIEEHMRKYEQSIPTRKDMPRLSSMPMIVAKVRDNKDMEIDLSIRADGVLSDIWEIPCFFAEIFTQAKIDIVAYEDEGDNLIYDITVHDSSSDTNKKEPRIIKNVVAISAGNHPWTNEELIKECGLIPYLFYVMFGCDVKMVCARNNTEYSYLSILPGLKMEFFDEDGTDCRAKWISDNAKDIDLLIVRGAYIDNHDLVVEYKGKNPQGKIFIGLDANGEWMDRIRWDDPTYTEMMQCCDVRGAACKKMTDHLNAKWPWKIVTVRNGFYPIGYAPNSIEDILAKKQRILLTVARNGDWAKGTDVAMEAFERISNDIPEYNMIFVGPILPEFEEYISNYYAKYPKLKGRVSFVGNVSDRVELHRYFESADVFFLSSRTEGGTNVICEALFSGCAIAITEVDTCQDAIGPIDADDCICGLSSPIDDVDAFAKNLYMLCREMNLKELQKNARKRGEKYYDLVNITEELYGNLCG